MPEQDIKEVRVLRKGLVIPGSECVQLKGHGAVIFMDGEGCFPEATAKAAVDQGVAVPKPENILTPAAPVLPQK